MSQAPWLSPGFDAKRTSISANQISTLDQDSISSVAPIPQLPISTEQYQKLLAFINSQSRPTVGVSSGSITAIMASSTNVPHAYDHLSGTSILPLISLLFFLVPFNCLMCLPLPG